MTDDVCNKLNKNFTFDWIFDDRPITEGNLLLDYKIEKEGNIKLIKDIWNKI